MYRKICFSSEDEELDDDGGTGTVGTAGSDSANVGRGGDTHTAAGSDSGTVGKGDDTGAEADSG